MATYEYRILLNENVTGAGDETSAGNVRAAREALLNSSVGAVGKIERRTVGDGGGRVGPWLTHRAYVVNAAGIVRRTDRPTTAPSERNRVCTADRQCDAHAAGSTWTDCA